MLDVLDFLSGSICWILWWELFFNCLYMRLNVGVGVFFDCFGDGLQMEDMG